MSATQPHHFVEVSSATTAAATSTPAFLFNSQAFASSATTPASTEASMLIQQLQQVATSVPSTCQSMFMNELLLKHATAALAAQHLETIPASFAPTLQQQPMELQKLDNQSSTAATTPQPASVKAEDEQKSVNICCVCNDEASGRHYGSVTCFGCKGFFRRTVRANKVYTCRYDKQCQIDKIGRNVCRSCRFRKCLEVGMEPDAIRPDRDKTGRQKNPRRPTNSMCSTKSYNDMDMDDQASQNAVSPNLDAQCASTASSPSDEDFNLRSYCESTAPSAAAVQQKDLIITTLSQIESICSEFLDDPKVQQDEGEQLTSPMDMITRTGVIAKRTQLDYSGRIPLQDPYSCEMALRRLVVTAIDYANTLKPLADMDPSEKVLLIRSFIASFILLTSAHKSVNEGRRDQILLPNGHFIDKDTPLSAFHEEFDTETKAKEKQWMEARINFVRNQIIDKLNTTVEKLNLSDSEFICLKAILVLDSNVSGLSEESAQKLSLARDHVQNALYVQLTEQYGDQGAVSRFGNLLMLVGNVTKTGVHFSNIIQMRRDLQLTSSPLTDLFSNY